MARRFLCGFPQRVTRERALPCERRYVIDMLKWRPLRIKRIILGYLERNEKDPIKKTKLASLISALEHECREEERIEWARARAYTQKRTEGMRRWDEERGIVRGDGGIGWTDGWGEGYMACRRNEVDERVLGN